MPENFDERFDNDERDFFDNDGNNSNGEENVEKIKSLILEATHDFMDVVKFLEDSNFYENKDEITREILLSNILNELKNLITYVAASIDLLMFGMLVDDSITPEYMTQARSLLSEEINILEKINDKIIGEQK